MNNIRKMAATKLSFMLILLLQFATAKYVQYEIYSNKDCTERSLESFGIFAGDGECLPSHPEPIKFLSRKVTCSGITNYPAEACQEVSEKSSESTSLDKCTEIVNSPGKYIKYSCQLGGYYRSFASNSPFAKCETVEIDTGSGVSDEFFFEDRCTNAFDEVLLTSLVRSDLMKRVNTSFVERHRWDNKVNCSGDPDLITVHPIDVCVVDPTDNEGVSLVKLTSAATTQSTGYVTLVVLNLMAILALFA